MSCISHVDVWADYDRNLHTWHANVSTWMSFSLSVREKYCIGQYDNSLLHFLAVPRIFHFYLQWIIGILVLVWRMTLATWYTALLSCLSYHTETLLLYVWISGNAQTDLLLCFPCSIFGSLNLTTARLSGVGASFQKHSNAESKGIKAHFNMDESGILALDRVSTHWVTGPIYNCHFIAVILDMFPWYEWTCIYLIKYLGPLKNQRSERQMY